MVVIADVAFVRGFIVVPFQNPIRCLGIAGITIDVHNGKTARLLLGDTEDIAVKARRLYTNHVGMALVQLHRKDEHIADSVHRLTEVGPPVYIEAVYVKVCNPRHFVCGQGNLLVPGSPHFEIGVGRGDGCVVLDRPVQDGAQLAAHRVDRGCLQASVLAEWDEITPEDIGNLDGA